MPHSQLTIEYALLGLLHQQPNHGYELYQQWVTEKGLSLIWRLKQSQCYALLAKLEQQGYITATLEPQEARPPRKILQLTATGREAFLSWVQTPVAQGREMRMEFMAKLYYARRSCPATTAALIGSQRNVCQKWLASLQAQAAVLSTERSFERLVYQFRIGQVEAMIHWLDMCEQTQIQM